MTKSFGIQRDEAKVQRSGFDICFPFWLSVFERIEKWKMLKKFMISQMKMCTFYWLVPPRACSAAFRCIIAP